MKVHRVYIPEARKMCLDQQELDENLQPTEILIKTQYSAISAGTETARYLGWDGPSIFPTTSGGANVGEIIAVGSSVDGFAVGDRVTSFSNHDSHVKCDSVVRDYGYNGQRIGVKVPTSLDGPSAALTYHFAVGMASVRESEVTLGDEALVIGGGLIGNTAAQLFRCTGAFVMLSDISEARLAIARQCGISATINPSQVKLTDAIRKWTGGRMLQFVILAVEGAQLLTEVIPLLRPRGQVILLGGYRRACSMDIQPVFSTLQGRSGRIVTPSAWQYPIPELPQTRHSTLGNYRQIMTLMVERRLAAEPLVQLVRPQDCHAVFEDLVNNKDKYLGAVFDWTRFSG